jgi:hypothetical protein
MWQQYRTILVRPIPLLIFPDDGRAAKRFLSAVGSHRVCRHMTWAPRLLQMLPQTKAAPHAAVNVDATILRGKRCQEPRGGLSTKEESACRTVPQGNG